MKRLLFLFTFFTSIQLYSATIPEILINRRAAERLQLQQGDIVEISLTGDMKKPQQFRVSAIYEEPADPSLVPLKRNYLKMHLSDLENLTGKKDQLDMISIQLKKGSNASNIAARLNADAIGFTAYSAQELANRSSTTFVVVSRFHQAIAFISMTAGAIFIFALMVMRVEDQRKNLAILTVTGISKQTILKSLMLEAVFFAFIASLLGAVLGSISARVVNLYYQHYYQTTLTFAEVTGDILIRAMCIAFFLGIISGTFSWFRLRRLAVLQELGR
jgi:ABC-type lipoprotein release transport system permease subunit